MLDIPMPLFTSSSSRYFSLLEQCEFLEIDEDELDMLSLDARVVESPTREILLYDRLAWTTSTSSDLGIDAVSLSSKLSRLAPAVAKEFLLPRTMRRLLLLSD